jgi:hypothetical protein
VIVAVLGEIPECPGGFDLARDLHASACREVLELGDEPGVGFGRERSFGHRLEATGLKMTS